MKRKLLVLALTLLLVVSMAVPAFAGTNSMSGDYGGIGYDCFITTSTSSSGVRMTCDLNPYTIKVEGENFIRFTDGTAAYGNRVSSSGNSSVRVAVNNIAYNENSRKSETGRVVHGRGYYYIGVNYLFPLVAFP